jgi:hypothetical protein
MVLDNALNTFTESLRLLLGKNGMDGIGAASFRLLFQRTLGDAESAADVIAFVQGAQSGTSATATDPAHVPKLSLPSSSSDSSGSPYDVRLFSWQLSYFSGKIRAYLRFKARGRDQLRFDDINASPEIIQRLLVPLTHTNVVPQLQLPNGSFCQDSTEIIEKIEALFPLEPVIPDAAARPKQRLACKLLELFGDEWLIVAGFHWRW